MFPRNRRSSDVRTEDSGIAGNDKMDLTTANIDKGRLCPFQPLDGLVPGGHRGDGAQPERLDWRRMQEVIPDPESERDT